MSETVTCPSCSTEMQSKMYEGINIDKCPGCNGTWLDWGEMGPIVEKREKDFSEEEQVASLEARGEDPSGGKTFSCPSCGSEMEKFQYAVNSGVFLDRCSNRCGLWLDEGELEKVQMVMEEYDDRHREPETEKTEVPMPDVKKCPRCDKEMNVMDYENTKIDICPECEGTWCDYDELLKITETKEETFSEERLEKFTPEEDEAQISREEELSPELDCVICGDLMERNNYQYTSGIIVDSCRKGHGVWLDKGELEDVQAFEEQWEGKGGELMQKYAGKLGKAREEMEQQREENIQELKVSHFGFLNRWVRALARKGFF